MDVPAGLDLTTFAADSESANVSTHKVVHSIHVAHWNFGYVREPLIVSLFLISVALVKIVWHHMKKISGLIPESCMLILLGCLFGFLFKFDQTHNFIDFLKFSSRTFFLYLLPPIILESSYSLKDRAFVENLGTILLYAVVGTVLNIVIIALGILALATMGAISKYAHLTAIDCFVFGSLIAAVDPVAVLSIFEEVGVNKMLFFMVFGESLLNDAVTVVVYNLVVTFNDLEYIGIHEFGMGLARFICVAGGACVIGFISGFVTSFITKFTAKIRVVEPILMYSIAYLSYLLAELVHFSGIISIICCGIIQAMYAAGNISPKSFITVNFFAKVMSSCTESIIFIILGVMLVEGPHQWSTSFVLWSLLLCLVARFAVVYFLTWIVNFVEEGLRKISHHEQFVMSYGGLRGAVSFSLAFMLNDQKFKEKQVMLTTALVIIMFTVFVQGITIKPIVRLLRIRIQSKNSSVFVELNRGLTNHVATAMEDLIGHRASHYVHETCTKLSQKVIRPAIQKHPTLPGSGLLSIYTEAALQSQLHPGQPGMKRQLTAVNAVIDSLQVLEGSQAPSYLAERIAESEDRSGAASPAYENAPISLPSPSIAKLKLRLTSLKKRKVPESLDLDNTKGLLAFRDLLHTPLQQSVAMRCFDKNMSSFRSHENLRKFAHLVKQRHDYPSTKDGIASMMGALMLPVINHRTLSGTTEEDDTLFVPVEFSDPTATEQFPADSCDGATDKTNLRTGSWKDNGDSGSDSNRPMFTLENMEQNNTPDYQRRMTYFDNRSLTASEHRDQNDDFLGDGGQKGGRKDVTVKETDIL